MGAQKMSPKIKKVNPTHFNEVCKKLNNKGLWHFILTYIKHSS